MVAVLLCVEFAARVAEPRLPPPDTWPTVQSATKADQIVQLVNEGSTVDVAFLGSSVVVQGIDPIAFNAAPANLTSYNAALDGASMRGLEIWAQELVFPLLDPRVVVIGVITRDLNDRGKDQEDFYESLRSSEGLAQVQAKGTDGSLIDQVTNSSALLRIRPVLRQPGTVLRHLLGRDADTPPLPGPFGAAPIDASAFTYDFSESWRSFWQRRHLNDYGMGGEEFSALQRLVESALAQDREVVLVEMPVHRDYLTVQPGGAAAITVFHEALATLGLWDAVDLIALTHQFESDAFRDPAHLNPTGAEILARDLAAYISTQGDHIASTVPGPSG